MPTTSSSTGASREVRSPRPRPEAVGFNPVSVTPSRTSTAMVCRISWWPNQGSDDVSVLLGRINLGAPVVWTATQGTPSAQQTAADLSRWRWRMSTRMAFPTWWSPIAATVRTPPRGGQHSDGHWQQWTWHRLFLRMPTPSKSTLRPDGRAILARSADRAGLCCVSSGGAIERFDTADLSMRRSFSPVPRNTWPCAGRADGFLRRPGGRFQRRQRRLAARQQGRPDEPGIRRLCQRRSQRLCKCLRQGNDLEVYVTREGSDVPIILGHSLHRPGGRWDAGRSRGPGDRCGGIRTRPLVATRWWRAPVEQDSTTSEDPAELQARTSSSCFWSGFQPCKPQRWR